MDPALVKYNSTLPPAFLYNWPYVVRQIRKTALKWENGAGDPLGIES